jgi:hypothetical protein
MKPFVVNRYGQIVFPSNFFPELDFSVFGTLEQLSAMIRRDFEDKAPTEADIVSRLEGRGYASRYDLLRDLALDLFWVNRYAMTMYRKQPTRWRDVPRHREDVFLPLFRPWDGGEQAAAIESGYRALAATWDEGTETKVFNILLDVFRYEKGAGAELPPSSRRRPRSRRGDRQGGRPARASSRSRVGRRSARSRACSSRRTVSRARRASSAGPCTARIAATSSRSFGRPARIFIATRSSAAAHRTGTPST